MSKCEFCNEPLTEGMCTNIECPTAIYPPNNPLETGYETEEDLMEDLLDDFEEDEPACEPECPKAPINGDGVECEFERHYGSWWCVTHSNYA